MIPRGASQTRRSRREVELNTKSKLSKEEMRQRLTSEQYAVTQEKGTEPAFSGRYVYNKDDGSYSCVCCGAELFSSYTKYESGSGWPSARSRLYW